MLKRTVLIVAGTPSTTLSRNPTLGTAFDVATRIAGRYGATARSALPAVEAARRRATVGI